MRRRAFITLLGGAAAWPLAARAQQAAKIHRIGVLETTAAALNAANISAFREGLKALGYIAVGGPSLTGAAICRQICFDAQHSCPSTIW